MIITRRGGIFVARAADCAGFGPTASEAVIRLRQLEKDKERNSTSRIGRPVEAPTLEQMGKAGRPEKIGRTVQPISAQPTLAEMGIGKDPSFDWQKLEDRPTKKIPPRRGKAVFHFHRGNSSEVTYG